jgi:predicted transcriptional regulator
VKEILENISRNIKKLKKEMTIKQLAEKADISPNTLYKVIYLQKDDIQLSTLLSIAKALKISLDRLVGL